MQSHFFAFLSRMKYITRWALMRNTQCENIAEHSYSVSVIAHALAVIRKDIFNLPAEPERTAICAMYHDSAEILTGDLPTPVKYHNPEIRDAYKKVEKVSSDKLLSLLPQELYSSYYSIVNEEDKQIQSLVKAADKLSAYIKCIEEFKAGNHEFAKAEVQIKNCLNEMNMPEVDYFIKTFIPSFSLTLDELE